MGAEQRMRYIDGLRGIAVLGVVVYHTWLAYPALQHNYWLNIVLDSGRHGVELFFVLSGFCLSYPSLLALRMKGHASFDVAKYGARRLVRILPPYYAAIVVCGLALMLGRFAPGYHVTAADVIRQAFFLDNKTTLINPSFWTLAIEFRWYFVMPFALWLWVKSPRAFGLVLLAVPILWLTDATSKDLLFLPGFLLGIVAAEQAILGSRFTRLAPLALLVLTPIAILIDPHHGRTEGGFNILWMLAAFCFVVSASEFSRLRSACSARWLTAIGLASYSIYLVHQPFIEWAMRVGVSPPATLAAALVAGFVFWWVAERPFMATRLRSRCVAVLQARLSHYTGRLDIPDPVVTLGAPRSEEPELVAV